MVAAVALPHFHHPSPISSLPPCPSETSAPDFVFLVHPLVTASSSARYPAPRSRTGAPSICSLSLATVAVALVPVAVSTPSPPPVRSFSLRRPASPDLQRTQSLAAPCPLPPSARLREPPAVLVLEDARAPGPALLYLPHVDVDRAVSRPLCTCPFLELC